MNTRVVELGSMVYVRAAPETMGDAVAAQTREVLRSIDRLLQDAGSDKSKLLTAQVWLADMKDLEAHDAVWNEWVDPAHPPLRACVPALLWRPEMRVEIMVTAAK
jgi:enamine deaminase RidA (YjgF/YER057c/UK114 family)